MYLVTFHVIQRRARLGRLESRARPRVYPYRHVHAMSPPHRHSLELVILRTVYGDIRGRWLSPLCTPGCQRFVGSLCHFEVQLRTGKNGIIVALLFLYFDKRRFASASGYELIHDFFEPVRTEATVLCQFYGRRIFLRWKSDITFSGYGRFDKSLG